MKRAAPVAQMDRVSVSEAEGRGFESRRARQRLKQLLLGDIALVSRCAAVDQPAIPSWKIVEALERGMKKGIAKRIDELVNGFLTRRQPKSWNMLRRSALQGCQCIKRSPP